MKAYTVTVENSSKFGKTVISAPDYKGATAIAEQICPPGFRVVRVLDNSLEQRVSHRDRQEARHSRGLASSHGRAAERCSFFAPSNVSDVSSVKKVKSPQQKSKKAKVIIKAGVNVEEIKQIKEATKNAQIAEKARKAEKAAQARKAKKAVKPKKAKKAVKPTATAKKAAKLVKPKKAAKTKPKKAKKTAPKKLQKRPGWKKPSKK